MTPHPVDLEELESDVLASAHDAGCPGGYPATVCNSTCRRDRLRALIAEVRAARQVEGALVRLLETQTISFSDEQAAAIDYACDEVLKRRIEPKEPAALASPSVPPPQPLIDACPECGEQDNHVHDNYGDNYPAPPVLEEKAAPAACQHDHEGPCAVVTVEKAAQEAGEETAALKEGIRARLRDHYLTGIQCDEHERRDRPTCSCSAIDLGWHPSVGAAVDAWITHALGEVIEPAAGAGRRIPQPAEATPGAVSQQPGAAPAPFGGVWIGEVRPTAEALAAAQLKPTAGPPKSPAALPKEEVAPDWPCPHGRNSWSSCPHCNGINSIRAGREPMGVVREQSTPAPQPLEEQLPKEGSAVAPVPGDAEKARDMVDRVRGHSHSFGQVRCGDCERWIRDFAARVRSEERERAATIVFANQSASCNRLADLIRASDLTEKDRLRLEVHLAIAEGFTDGDDFTATDTIIEAACRRVAAIFRASDATSAGGGE